MCENLSFKTMCEVPFLEELVRGEECNHDSMFFDGGFFSKSYCQEAEYFGESDCVVGKCMVDFPCAENEVAMLLECWAQVDLNHLLHEADDFWID